VAIEYLPFEKREALGIFTLEERTAMLDEGSYDEPAVPKAPTAEAVAAAKELPKFDGGSVPVDIDAPMCFECGIKMKGA
ncbi:hypothetical protein ACMYNC_23300, partial [Salmonella enterica subsp. enterica serovar Enteritidis]|uniref:hypothetical protein n=1 Tax=Salmonella enterica TaxID=28901 RepID=UPI0039E8BE2E